MVLKIGNSRSYIYLVSAMTLGYIVIRSSICVVFRVYTTCAMFAVADSVGWVGLLWGGLFTAYTSNETVAAVYGRNDDDDDDDNDNNSNNNNSKK